MLAGLVSGLAGPAVAGIPAQGVARLAVALAGPALAVVPELEPGQVDLRQGDADQVLALAPDHLSLGDVFAQILLDLALDDLAKAVMVVVDV